MKLTILTILFALCVFTVYAQTRVDYFITVDNTTNESLYGRMNVFNTAGEMVDRANFVYVDHPATGETRFKCYLLKPSTSNLLVKAEVPGPLGQGAKPAQWEGYSERTFFPQSTVFVLYDMHLTPVDPQNPPNNQ
jgi:hypothetical protein